MQTLWKESFCWEDSRLKLVLRASKHFIFEAAQGCFDELAPGTLLTQDVLIDVRVLQWFTHLLSQAWPEAAASGRHQHRLSGPWHLIAQLNLNRYYCNIRY